MDEYYKSLGIHEFEGHSQQDTGETKFLTKIIKNDALKNVIEIGFNGGHSADTFLKNNPNINLVSFDLGDHHYVKHGKAYIDTTYPNRHTLILGDSRLTIPEFIKTVNIKYDLIFIDGGHYYDIPEADLRNCRLLAHKNTIVIMDDTKRTDVKGWNVAVNHAWNRFKYLNFVREVESYDFSPTHGLSYGYYNLCEIFILSLMRDDRREMVEVNTRLFPEIQVIKSVNGYNKIETLQKLHDIGIPYRYIDFKTYGTLANWITKYNMLKHQVAAEIPYMCMLEDDVELFSNFKDYINNAIQYLKDDLNILRLLDWGEGYITSLEGAKRIIAHIETDGIVNSIDNQLRCNCGREMRLGDVPIKLLCGANLGDCLKTDSFEVLPTLNEIKY
jgi:hypothetical protein